jgi:hypothetical protein
MLALVAMAIVLAAGPAAAASPSELLEKAIYTEETVGNLDEAMKLYEQVIAEGKSSQEAAAQAQYRLALCYQKKGREADAKAAFETLIENYPDAKDLVAQARKHLPSALKLLPAPWVLGERMQLNMKLPTGIDIGTMIYMVDAAKYNGKDVTQCSTRGLVTANGASSYSTVLCQPDSFAPKYSHWKHSLLGAADAVYRENSVEVTVVGKSEPFTIDFTPPAFDNEQCVELFRRLPLASDYKTTLTVVTSLGGSKIMLPLTVSKIESVTVPAGTFECYKLELAVVGQTFWVSTDEHRYVVRFAAGGVTAELAKIEQLKPGQQDKVSGDDFSLTLPAGWISYAPKVAAESDEHEVALLDPHADATCEVNVRPKTALKEAQRDSTKAWTESFIKDVKQRYADFQVAEPGLVDATVGGHPATQIVADFTDGGKKMRTMGVAVTGDKSAATLRFTTEADKFDKLRAEFDAIVASFTLN